MRRSRLLAGGAALAVAAAGLGATPAQASSHREAPLISQDPIADNTDLYVFRDAKDPAMVNIVANYIGLEQPAGGPNFAKFGDDVLYEIHIDNNGDVRDDIIYQFRFKTFVDNPETFLYNTGPITTPDFKPQNIRQEFDVRRIDANGLTTLVTNFRSPPVNIGPRSTPNYEAVQAQQSIFELPGGGLVFAGQRKDPFFVDLGSAFDLLGLRPLNEAHAIKKAAEPGRDGLAGKNVHSIVLQLPIKALTSNKATPTTVDDKRSVVGVWASSSRQSTRVLGANGTSSNSGSWVQVSRLGLPLVNEVLIPLGQKDRWNSRGPSTDLAADGFGKYILDPEPARLIPVLYPGVKTPPAPRTADIVPILQGAGAGLSAKNYLPPADLLRINLAVPVTASPDRLGILAGDKQGFPNGRRLIDDVVDIELRLLAGGTPFTPEFNKAPNNALTDGVDATDKPLLTRFPWVGTPISGYDQPATG
jgi:hypothetical protein